MDMIPDDGYADGGEPYTDEEMDIIDQDVNLRNYFENPNRQEDGYIPSDQDDWQSPPAGVILEGLPTPPLARDKAAETGKPVQDCWGEWHGGGSHEEGPPGGRLKAGLDFERVVKLVVAEDSDVAKREQGRREMHDALNADDDTSDVLLSVLSEGGIWGKVMESVIDASAAEGNDEQIVEMFRAIAEGNQGTQGWFASLADALAAKMEAESLMSETWNASWDNDAWT